MSLLSELLSTMKTTKREIATTVRIEMVMVKKSNLE